MSEKRDDLTKIKGLGRGSQKLLNAVGIHTFADLRKASQKKLRLALNKGGSSYERIDSAKWPEAAEGFWSEQKQPQPNPLKNSGTAKATLPDNNSTPEPQTVVFVTTAMNARGAYQSGAPVKFERLLTPDEVQHEYRFRQEELDLEFERARSVLKEWLPEIRKRKDFKDRHITGVSVRFRTKFGHVVSPLEVAIVINVAAKLPADELKPLKYEMFSSTYEGVPVKIVEGRFELLADQARLLRGSTQPSNPLPLDKTIVGGATIAPRSNHLAFGTLGMVVTTDTGEHIGLSCQHVVDDQVDQLGTGGLNDSREFGEVTESRPPSKDFTRNGRTESLDCALIKIPDSDATISFPPPGSWYRELRTPDTAAPLDLYYADRPVQQTDSDFDLFKYGSGTGRLVSGRIEAVNRSLILVRNTEYRNNFSVVLNADPGRSFANPGDSGSVLVLQATVFDATALEFKEAYVAVGILFAALVGGNAGIACNMCYVLDSLGADVPDFINDRRIDDWS